jgi:hypothetical protein
MAIPTELATACADVRLAEDADSIAGRRPRYVAAPDSTAEASALLRAAAALGLVQKHCRLQKHCRAERPHSKS